MKEGLRLKVTDKLGDVEVSEFEIPLKDLLHRIKEMIQEYGGNSCLVYDKYRYLDYSEDPYPCFRVRRERLETDQEMEDREAKYRKSLEREEKIAYQKYLKLKEKFEQNS